MSIEIRDGSTTGQVVSISADPDAPTGSKYVKVNFPIDETKAGFAALCAENDPGTKTGSRALRAARSTEDYNLAAGVKNSVFNEVFVGTTVDYSEWKQTLSSMTIVQANGMIVLNSAASVTDTNYAILQSYRTVLLNPPQTLKAHFRCAMTKGNARNNVAELGVGWLATTAAPTDGAFFRWDSDGKLYAVVSNNSSETSTKSAEITQMPDGEFHYYLIYIERDTAWFFIDDIAVAKIAVVAASPLTTRSIGYPIVARVRNAGLASAACKMQLGQVVAHQGGSRLERPYSHLQASMGNVSHQGPSSSWTTLGTQSNWTNSPTIATGTLSATAVPSGGYAGTTMGGLFQFAAGATGLTSANIIFAYLNPAGTAAVAGKNLYITGIAIYAVNAGATVAGTPTVYQWLLGYNSTAVTLATGEAATTNIARFLPLGIMSWTVGQLAGQQANPIVVSFSTPIPVWSGHYLHILQRVLVGTATASQLTIGSVLINGYWE